MPTKKQLDALAKGRAIRKENIKKNKTMKCKTKAEYKKLNDKSDKEKSIYSEPTQIIIYNGEPLEVPISKIPKGKNKWKKLSKYTKNVAIAAATLGALGYGVYNSKKLYDNYLHYPVDIGKEGLKSAYNLLVNGGKLIDETKKEWGKSNNAGKKLGNVIRLYSKKGNNFFKSAKNKLKDWTGLDSKDFVLTDDNDDKDYSDIFK